MNDGTMVTRGWLYNRKKIVSKDCPVGIVVSEKPFQDFLEYEKLKNTKGKWEVYTQHDVVESVSVLWPSGKVSTFPTCNLVEIR